MYHAYFALTSMMTHETTSAAMVTGRVRCGRAGALRWVMYSSYIRPNHQVNANANSGDLVSEIVENVTSGQHRNSSITSARASGPAGAGVCAVSVWMRGPRSGWAKSIGVAVRRCSGCA